MKVGYTKAIRGLTADPQFDQLVQWGCEPEHVWGDAKRAGWGIDECISSLREGDVLGVVEVAVLGYSKTKALPVDRLRQRLKAIDKQGATIFETTSGIGFKPDSAAVELILNAAKRLNRQPKNGKPGPKPKHNYTDAQWREIAGVWRDPRYKNDPQRVAAIRALGERFRNFDRNVWFSKKNPIRNAK